MKRLSFLIAFASLMLFSFGLAHAVTEITLDNMTGLHAGDSVIMGESVRWEFRLTYTPGDGSVISGFSNGLEVYTHLGGAYTDNFTAITYDTFPIGWKVMFDLVFQIMPFSIDGLGADTVAFGGAKISGPGIVDGTDALCWWIETTPGTDSDTLCIDSAYYPPGGEWLWSTNGLLGIITPDWGGPYCFHVHDTSQAAATLVVTPDTLYFTAVEGGANPDADTFTVSEAGGGAIAFNLAETSGWFALDKTGGTTPEDVEVSVDITGLTAADTYFVSVTVSSGEADNSPQFAYISLEVTSALKFLEVTPDTLYFTAVEGGANPDADTFTVSEAGGGAIAFTLAETSGWFDLDKTGGTTPEDVEVSVDISSLTAGDYFDLVTVSSGDAVNSPQFAYINLEVTEPVTDTADYTLYVISDNYYTHPILEAYDVADDATISLVETHSLLSNAPQGNNGPVGTALDIKNKRLYVTYEFVPVIAVFDAENFNFLGQVDSVPMAYVYGYGNLAGMAIDQANEILYVAERDGDEIAQYDLAKDVLTDPTAYLGTTTMDITNIMGLAYDDVAGELYVTNWSQTIYVYDPSLVQLRTFTVPHYAIAIAVDGTAGSNVDIFTTDWGTSINKHSTSSGQNITVSSLTRPAGITVNLSTGYVYVTVDDPAIKAFDNDLNPVQTVSLPFGWTPTDLFIGEIKFDFGIKGQCVQAPDLFDAVDLDTLVMGGTPPFTFACTGYVDLTVNIDPNNVLTVTYPGGWCGSETLTFTVTDSTGKSYSDDATFTVVPGSFVLDIPDQDAPFVPFNLDNYLNTTCVDPADVTWSASGWMYFVVDIDPTTHVASVTNPLDSTQAETITFMATYKCGTDSDDATFDPIPGCYPELPGPELVLEDCVEYYIGSDGQPYTRYRLDVLNWDEYPDILFEPAPDLPPCGDNDSASRTWVDIYDGDDNRIYGFCALGSASSLNDIWFALPRGQAPPDSVYITLTDRRCELVYTSNLAGTGDVEYPPNIDCPSEPLEVTIAAAGEVCVDLLIEGADSVYAGEATWFDDELCFMADTNGIYIFAVIATNACGSDSCVVTVVIMIEGGIIPTYEWINVYCDYPELNGVPLAPGDIITAYDPDGVPCGIDTVRADGSFGFMPIYRDDPYSTDVDEGAEPGDVIAFTINGEEVFPEPPVVWTANGDSFELCTFTTERCVEIFLHTGWNLISWNVAYSAGIDEIMAQLAKSTCVEVILSFDQGALTYDPNLPEFSTLLDVDYYHGYWFKMNCDATLEICGFPIEPDEGIVIYSGWNLVSYWPNDTLSVEEGFESILDNLLVALGYDYGGLTWLPDDTLFNTLTELWPLFGYWAKSSADDMLAYPGFIIPPVATAKDQDGSQIAATSVVPSRTWMSLYGSGITLDGVELISGATIEAYTSNGILCGSSQYVDGLLKFTPVYGYDPLSEVSADYPKDGDPVTLYVNGTRVYPDVEWAGHSSRVQLDQVFSTVAGAGLVPDRYALLQNYPNPFNPTTEIAFTLPVASRVSLEIYNVLGQRVTMLAEGILEAGEHIVVWDGTDANGHTVSTGIYLYRLQAGDFVDTKKMMLMK